MEKLVSTMLRRRKLVVCVYAALLAVCALLSTMVGVNYNLMDYLPDNAPSTIALNVMNEEYTTAPANARVMVPVESIAQMRQTHDALAAVEGVEIAGWLGDAVNLYQPLEMAPQKTVEAWYKDGQALYSITVDTDREAQAFAQIREIIGESGSMAGTAVSTNVATQTTGSELTKMFALCIPIILIILLISTTSWIEPVLFLASIGVAIVLNMGTNILLGEISFVTKAAASILQLAVSMDYSIFLLHRFASFRKEGLDVEHAMVQAVTKSFTSILSSGITTVIGFAALIFMEFKIGPDMGVVMAKAIVISLVAVFTLLPTLAVLCCKWIDKTQHRSFLPKFEKMGKFVTKVRVPALLLFLVMVVPCFLGQQADSFYYGSSRIFDESTPVGQEQAAIESTFGEANNMALLLPVGDLAAERAVNDGLLEMRHVSSVISYVGMAGAEIPQEYVEESTLSKLVSPHYTRMVVTLDSAEESSASFAAVEDIRALAQQYYPDAYHLTGGSVNTLDMKDTVTKDMVRVNLIAILAIAVVLIFAFKSASIPILLLLAIEGSVWINLAVPYFTGQTIFYIGYLIVSSVQLGATVDYAILFTDRYFENRRQVTKLEAARRSIAQTTGSILTSAGILTVAAFVLGVMSSNQVLSQLGFLISRGAVISGLTVLLVLPALLLACDGLIRKTTLKTNFFRGNSAGKQALPFPQCPENDDAATQAHAVKVQHNARIGKDGSQ